MATCKMKEEQTKFLCEIKINNNKKIQPEVNRKLLDGAKINKPLF